MATWISIKKQPPRRHETVLLFRSGTLYPVVGSLFGRNPHGGTPERTLYMLEEGGPEDGLHRSYPFLHESAEPTHWMPLPETPVDPRELAASGLEIPVEALSAMRTEEDEIERLLEVELARHRAARRRTRT